MNQPPAESRQPTGPQLTSQSVSPRRRRLRRTVATLCSLAALGAALGLLLHSRSRPAPYRPDETSADITSELSRQLPPEAPQPRLTDVTRAAGLAAFRNFAGTRTSEMPEDIGPGLAWGDIDNDGDDDLFLVSVGGAMNVPEGELQPCALFENRGDGTFSRFAGFPELRLRGNGAAWGDYDGDGFLDLVVSGFNSLRLFHNDPAEDRGRRFTPVTGFPNPPGFWTGVTWGDFDNDRAPDLYVCGYLDYVVAPEDRRKTSQQIGTMVPFTLNPASFAAGTNLLLRNNRDGTFTDVAPALNVSNPQGRSLGALWHDFDEDGWLDLYVANDISDNVFYRNTGGRFEDISHPALVADYRSAMGLAVGDYNRDGDDDIFVSHWVAQENALYDNTWADFHQPRPGAGAGTNDAAAISTAKTYPLRFLDIADQKGLGQIALAYVGWGAEFADLDGDGWLDLVVANGSTIEEDGPPPRRLRPQDTFLFWNQRGEYFHNLASRHPGLREKHVSRGLAVSDFDLDGDMDFIIADLGEGVRLFRNDMQTGHWLKVRLRSHNHRGQALGSGDGSKVTAHVAGASLRALVSSVSYLSQSSHTLHFGLGSATRVDRLEVRWHAGGTSFFDHLDADCTYEFIEGDPTPRKIAGRPPMTSAAAAARPAGGPASPQERQRTLEFWSKQRAAMSALKVEQDCPKAIRLFREALALNPAHEDSLYYLASCLASTGQTSEALAQLAELKRLNPQSQRAFAQWGILRALSSRAPADLQAAEESLARAHAINPEETGALLGLGEVALLRGETAVAERRLANACRTNPKAVGGFFLQGYVRWRQGDDAGARARLTEARAALGPDWQPKGATSEGDVHRKQHVEKSPLASYWEAWDGEIDPSRAYTALAADLKQSTP